VLLLKDRLCESLGRSTGGATAARRPFNVVNVIAEKPKPQVTAAAAAASGQRSRTTSATYYQVCSVMLGPDLQNIL